MSESEAEQKLMEAAAKAEETNRQMDIELARMRAQNQNRRSSRWLPFNLNVSSGLLKAFALLGSVVAAGWAISSNWKLILGVLLIAILVWVVVEILD